MQIRPAIAADAEAVGRIVGPVARAGETYALARHLSDTEAAAYWFGLDREAFVAEAGGTIVGSYYLRANQQGGGAHVANAGYVTASHAAGRGVAWRMCEHSLATARVRGFKAMQFNFVVSSNERAVRLWRRCGFEIVGRLADAFEHPELVYVDALVMYRRL